MSRLRFLVAALALGGCSEAPPPPPPSLSQASWSEAFDASGAGSLSGVWGSGPEDVFVVGGTNEGAEIYHYDGTRWSGRALDVPLLVWAHGFGPDDVYAVGVAGTMVHYDGASWTAIATGTTADLWGIFGFSPDDLWIVGGNPFEGEPMILHYDGAVFTPRTIDDDRGAHALFKVWGIDGAVFAVGQKGLVLRLEGDDWVAQDAGPMADQDFVSLWGTSPDHVVAVGGRQSARIAIWDGGAWTTIAPEGLAGLNGIHMPESSLAVIGGVVGFGGRFDPETRTVTREVEGLTNLDIHAVWGDGHGTHYAVGGTFAEPHRGVALTRTE